MILLPTQGLERRCNHMFFYSHEEARKFTKSSACGKIFVLIRASSLSTTSRRFWEMGEWAGVQFKIEYGRSEIGRYLLEAVSVKGW